MITVVTHHNPHRDIDVTRCIQSVNAALQPGDKHIFIECDGKNYADFAKARFDALKLGDYVCFVDDDDYISIDALSIARRCIIDNPNVGLYFTRESKDFRGDIIQCKAGDSYECLVKSATAIHHLSIFNTKYLNKECLDVAIQAECGIEWALRCWMALQHGAIHIPIEGYFHVLHDQQISLLMPKYYRQSFSFFKGVFAGWQKHYGQIPTYTLPEY